jgi:hypothetical protein
VMFEGQIGSTRHGKMSTHHEFILIYFGLVIWNPISLSLRHVGLVNLGISFSFILV